MRAFGGTSHTHHKVLSRSIVVAIGTMVQFEYLDRGWVNDVRFTFVSGQKTMAVADILFARGIFARGRVHFVEPFKGTLLREKSWFR